jgi:iron complex transport system ATP-binding protein
MLACHALSVHAGHAALLREVDFQLAPGERIAVLGENGAGKSTLLRLLAGEAPGPGLRWRGAVHLAGRAIGSWPARQLARLRAVLPQQTDLAFTFTALELVQLARYPHDEPEATSRAIARKALALADAAGFANREVTTLSGGERARVFLAACLAQLWETEAVQPRFLLLDEPTAALDLAHQHHLLDTARRFANERGLGLLAILHDLNLAAQYADRLLLLHRGRLLAQGRPDEVLTTDRIAEGFGVSACILAHPLRPGLLVATAAPCRGRG